MASRTVWIGGGLVVAIAVVGYFAYTASPSGNGAAGTIVEAKRAQADGTNSTDSRVRQVQQRIPREPMPRQHPMRAQQLPAATGVAPTRAGPITAAPPMRPPRQMLRAQWAAVRTAVGR
jgi:hypothetical protein